MHLEGQKTIGKMSDRKEGEIEGRRDAKERVFCCC